MRILKKCKSNVGGKRLSTTLKAQLHGQPALNDLRKNLLEREKLEAYVHQLITTKDVRPVMETLSRASEDSPATVTGWYTVRMAKCAGLPDSAIYMALNWVLVPLQLDIFNFRRSGSVDNDNEAVFMIDSTLSARRLHRLRENVMVLYTCQPLEVEVKAGISITHVAKPAEFEEAVEAALRGRYNAATRTLDLSRFHADPLLSEHFCPLHVQDLLEGVLMMALRKLEPVSGIILSNNYLCSLKALAAFSKDDFGDLEQLDVSANKIKDLGELENLGRLSIKTLVLSGNEVAKKESHYIRAILPQLKYIHGCLQSNPVAPVLVSLPKAQQLQGGESGSTGIEFAQQIVRVYYESFDDPAKRHQLTQFYDTKAAFSLSVSKQLGHVGVYSLYNRNHQSLRSPFARNSKLLVGSVALTQALGRFPLMMTSTKSASLDILIFGGSLRMLTLTGHFKESTSEGWEQRRFQRTFVLRRHEGHGGWLITNDMLSIISPHVDQKFLIAAPPPAVPVRPEDIDSSTVIVISDVEEETTTASNSTPKQVIDPMEKAFEELSLSMPKMALVTESTDEEMPPLVAIQPQMVNDLDDFFDLDRVSPLLADEDQAIELLGDIDT